MRRETADHIRIWFSGDDHEDREFAESIARQAQAFGTVFLMDVDAIERSDEAGIPRKLGWQGAPVYILSHSLVGSPSHRAKLLVASPRMELPGQRAFFVCRGLEVQELLESYPSLAELSEKVMIGEETDVDVLINELREYVELKKKNAEESRLALSVRLLASTAVMAVRPFAVFLYHFSFVASILLFLSIDNQYASGSPLQKVALLIAMFGAGFGVHLIPSFDFWPWMGRRWRLSLPSGGTIAGPQPTRRLAKQWLTGDCLSPAVTPLTHAEASSREMDLAVSSWQYLVRQTWRVLVVKFVLLWWLPFYVLIVDSWNMAIPALLAIGSGLGFPIAFGGAARWMQSRIVMGLGLSGKEDGRIPQDINLGVPLVDTAVSRADTMRLPVSDEVRFTQWVLNHSLKSGQMRRSWLACPDSVFVSYAWSDEAVSPVASAVVERLKEMDIPHFWDKEDIRDSFSSYRSLLGFALLTCTHLLVVIGRNYSKGTVVTRELQLSLQRWNSETTPAVICIVEQETAEELLHDPKIPSHLRFILKWCPQMTAAQATDPGFLKAIIQQRRRQGILRDLATLVTPQKQLSDFITRTYLR